jgi:3-oxoadipate enol-lactonase
MQLSFSRLAGEAGRGDLLVVGPSLGTSVEALWGGAAPLLADRFEVLGWDLPGHGRSRATRTPFTIRDLAVAVHAMTHPLVSGRRHVLYAGVSLGGTLALELATRPSDFTGLACIASAARIGDPAGWHQRAALVRAAGTPVLVSAAAERWFAPGFLERDPATANRLLLSLSDTDAESYALACEALAAYDLRGHLTDVSVPLVVAPGEHDVVVTPDQAGETAAAAGARLHVMTGCGHLPPAEDPAGTAQLLRRQIEENTDVRAT